MLVRIAGGALGPTLCALLAGHVEPRLAVVIATRLDPAYTARVAARMDPRRAIGVITALPPERTRDVAAEMAAAGEHVAMGRFVAHLSDEALAACLEVLGGADIVRIAFVLEGKERIPRVVELLGDARIDALAAEAAGCGLDDEIADLLAHLPPKLRRRLAARAGAWSPRAPRLPPAERRRRLLAAWASARVDLPPGALDEELLSRAPLTLAEEHGRLLLDEGGAFTRERLLAAAATVLDAVPWRL